MRFLDSLIGGILKIGTIGVLGGIFIIAPAAYFIALLCTSANVLQFIFRLLLWGVVLFLWENTVGMFVWEIIKFFWNL